jgi:hypothetical protein
MTKVNSILHSLKSAGLLDSGVLAAGIARGWASRADAVAYAVEQLVAGDERDVVVELASADDEETARILVALRQWALDDALPSANDEYAVRRWLYAALLFISRSDTGGDETLDLLEDAYSRFDYPYEMRECSRYYSPPDRDRRIQLGELVGSPIAAMNKLLSDLAAEFGLR